MKRILLQCVRVIDAMSRWTEKIGSLLVLPMIAVVFYEVVSRHFFNKPTIWAIDVSTLIFGVYIVWSGGPSVLNKGQVCMDALSTTWRPRTRALAEAAAYLLALSFCAVLVWQTTDNAVESWSVLERSNSVLAHPLYHWRALIAAGTWLLLLQVVSEVIKDLWLALTGEELR